MPAGKKPEGGAIQQYVGAIIRRKLAKVCNYSAKLCNYSAKVGNYSAKVGLTFSDVNMMHRATIAVNANAHATTASRAIVDMCCHISHC